MVFSSAVFLFVFMPGAFALALLSRRRVALQNALLAAVSVGFYAWGNPAYAILLLISVAVNYGLALAMPPTGPNVALSIPKNAPLRPRKQLLAVAVAFNIGILCVVKYAGFIAANLNLIPGVSVPLPNIPLPIGISFFTFQALSYVIDVYRGNAPAQRNFTRLLLYISFFPQLIAGPIVRYGDIEHALGERRMTPEGAAYGLRRFVAGLAKKLLLADTLGIIADKVFSMAASGGAAGAAAGFASGAGAARPAAQLLALPAWIGAVAYALQIYFDFSGYSDMAIGLGRTMGFNFKENFNYPYIACGMRDFWRRWHISLSSWFKEYLYIPLGGNRRGKARECANKIAVFFVTGLWHGANWTFVIWGLYHGVFLLLESFGAAVTRRIPKPVATAYALIVVVVGFVLFRSETIESGFRMISIMFTGWRAGSAAVAAGGFAAGGAAAGSIAAGGAVAGRIAAGGAAAGGAAVSAMPRGWLAANIAQALALLPPSAVTALSAAALAATPIAPFIKKKLPKAEPVFFAATLPLLVLCAMKLASDGYNPFIYFRF